MLQQRVRRLGLRLPRQWRSVHGGRPVLLAELRRHGRVQL